MFKDIEVEVNPSLKYPSTYRTQSSDPTSFPNLTSLITNSPST